MTGPFADPTLAGWHLLDLVPDYDVDLRDFAVLERSFTEPPTDSLYRLRRIVPVGKKHHP
jgi:hypothetical protein